MSFDPQHWEDFYLQTPPEALPWNAGKPDSELVQLVKEGSIPVGQALDIGTGPGHDAVFLIHKGFNVIGIDISPSAVKLARENASNAGLFGFFQVGDIRNIPVEDRFIDFANDRGCFHVLDPADRPQAINEVHRVLKKGGLYLLHVFSDKEPGSDGPHRFTRQELDDLFKGKFKILKFWEGVFEGPRKPKSYSLLMEKKMKRLLIVLLLLWPCLANAARVEIRDGRFYVDNEPFYVRGVGYAPWRPHQHPGISYAGTNYRWTKMDFQRIKAAHFNTIRTWDALEPVELALAQENGLMVVQGIWLDPKQDFSDPHNQQAAIAQVESIAGKSKDYDNVLGYLIMTEPSPAAVLDTGAEDTLEFFRRLKRAIQAVDPRPVSMDSWPPLAFMDYHDFDFVTFNLFAFWPKSLNFALGQAGMTRWFVDHFAPDKPFLVGETGGYAVSQASETAAGGYGGLTEYTQSLKDLDSLRATVEGHASGSFLVSWIDTWHYPKDPDTHDNEPWEWDGILAIPTDSEKDMDGIPRQIYHDVSAYNHLIPIEPKANHIYPIGQPIPIRVNVSDEVGYVRYSVNDGDWKYLDGSGHGWFQGFFKLPKLAKKRQTLDLQALDKDETLLISKQVSFLAGVLQETVTISPKNAAGGDRALEFVAKVEDSLHHPIVQRKVYFGCFGPVDFGERQGTVVTDAAGSAVFSCRPIDPSPTHYVFVAAGTDSPERVRSFDLRIFALGK